MTLALARIPADEVAPGAPDVSNPLAYETTISGVRKEHFSELRPDHMYFRDVDAAGFETRLFRGRERDDAREVTTKLADRRVRRIVFGAHRADGCVLFNRDVHVLSAATPAQREAGEADVTAINNELRFAGRPDGVTKAAVGLRTGCSVDLADSPPAFFRDKVLHLAISCDPSVDASLLQICEAYYDLAGGLLRVTLEHPVTGAQTQKEWSVLLPQNEPVYERARVLVQRAVVMLLAVEREILVGLPDYEDGVSVEEAARRQQQRLADSLAQIYARMDNFAAIATPESGFAA